VIDLLLCLCLPPFPSSPDFDSLIASAHSASDEIYDEIAVYSGLQVLPVYLVVADTSG
jgi:hypothetical protein